MEGLRIVLLFIGLGILIINFFINFANIVMIVRYCFATNSLDQYWRTFMKNSMSGRAIISSVIGLVLALVIFILITPIILIRKAFFKSKIADLMAKGLVFDYSAIGEPTKNSEGSAAPEFYTNVDQIGFDKTGFQIYNSIQIDVISVIAKLKEEAEVSERKFDAQVMQEITLRSGEKALVPLVLTVSDQDYPIYFLYLPQHHEQFRSIRGLLYEAGYRTVVYFSSDRVL